MEWLAGIPEDEWYLLNSYELFGLPLLLEIDEDLLEKRYIQFTQKVHPDRNIERQDWALLISSRINLAYEQLTRFRQRAELFYTEKLGISGKPNVNTILPVAFLEQVFLWNEAREEGELDLMEVEDVLEEVQDTLIELSGLTPFDDSAFRENLNKLKYLENLLDTEENT
jgi:DnaJ-domain-containing protein 1